MKQSRINEAWDLGTYGFTQQRKQLSFKTKLSKTLILRRVVAMSSSNLASNIYESVPSGSFKLPGSQALVH